MKFSDCLSAMKKGAKAVRYGVERSLLISEGMSVIEETTLDGDFSQLTTFGRIDFDEEGWEIMDDTREVCGITFTHRPDIVAEEVWVSEERGIRIRRLDGGWECSTTGTGLRLVRGGLTVDVAVGRLLDEAKEAARVAARVLGATVGGWQPIETAPTEDGVQIVGLCQGIVHEGRLCQFVDVLFRDGPHWMHGHEGQMEPTHWMPIPPVPEASK